MTDEPFTRTYELGRALGIEIGKHQEQERIIKKLEGYFELTQLPGDNGIQVNDEWDAGFQAALALIRGEQN